MTEKLLSGLEKGDFTTNELNPSTLNDVRGILRNFDGKREAAQAYPSKSRSEHANELIDDLRQLLGAPLAAVKETVGIRLSDVSIGDAVTLNRGQSFFMITAVCDGRGLFINEGGQLGGYWLPLASLATGTWMVSQDKGKTWQSCVA